MARRDRYDPFTSNRSTPAVLSEEFDYSASISWMDIRENLPFIDPENLSSQDVLEVLLHLFRQKPGFIDRGNEINNKETAWVNALLFRLTPAIDHDGLPAFVVEVIGSSVDRMANLRSESWTLSKRWTKPKTLQARHINQESFNLGSQIKGSNKHHSSQSTREA